MQVCVSSVCAPIPPAFGIRIQLGRTADTTNAHEHMKTDYLYNMCSRWRDGCCQPFVGMGVLHRDHVHVVEVLFVYNSCTCIHNYYA